VTVPGGSAGGTAMIWNAGRDIGLIFTGEHYPDESQMSDSLRIYEKLGPKFLLQLNGSFAGVLADLREQQLVLFNDRYGLGRIYYHERNGAVYFASEAKALLKGLPDLRRLDDVSLGETICLGCVLQNRTLFSGVSLLPAGSAWVFNPGKSPRKEMYFSPKQWESRITTSVSRPIFRVSLAVISKEVTALGCL
jgi:asparagine synthase (glutamine-hydrolysing)